MPDPKPEFVSVIVDAGGVAYPDPWVRDESVWVNPQPEPYVVQLHWEGAQFRTALGPCPCPTCRIDRQATQIRGARD